MARPASAEPLQTQGVRPAPSRAASARLWLKIDLVTAPFARACQGILTHPRVREVYPEYLITMHGILRSTVALMEAGAQQARSMGAADEVASGVAAYLEKHLEEERGHDEWLLEDLEVLGVHRAGVLGRIPSPTVAGVVGSQYYWALHYHPVALLGYFAFAEGFPPSAKVIEEFMARTGYPPEAFRTLAVHGELDPDHREEIDRTIDSLPLTSAQETVLGLSAISTAGLLTRCLEEIAEAVDLPSTHLSTTEGRS